MLLMLVRYRSRHLGILAFAALTVALLASVLFISRSIQHDIGVILEAQPDFIVQRVRAGGRVNAPAEWVGEIRGIAGVADVTPRIYGNYYAAPKGAHFLVVGIDFFDEQSSALLQKIVRSDDLRALLAEPQMVVGQAVKRFLEAHYYQDHYAFKTPYGEIVPVGIFATFDDPSRIVTNPMAVMEAGLARRIFGMGEGEVTDIAFNVPNEAEWDNIVTKLYLGHYDIRVITKTEMAKAYRNLYDYKGGLFLALYLVVMATFILILYQRYAQVDALQKREIGILRALGWCIQDVLKFQLAQMGVIALAAFVLGVAGAYLFVFVADAPLLRNIFLGGGNLAFDVTFAPVIDFGLLGSLFLFFMLPFLAAALVPTWRIAVTEPKEAML